MIIFKHSRFQRISVALTELTLGQAIALCKLPAERHEFVTTELLRYIAAQADQPRPTFVKDPLLWTVEERSMLVASYLAYVVEGGPDFPVGDLKLTDYLRFEADMAVPEADLGELNGKAIVMRPLLGIHAQVLESMCDSRGDWIIGAMACRLWKREEPVHDWLGLGETGVRELIKARVQKFKDMAESDFEAMFLLYAQGAEAQYHFFNIDFDDKGVVLVSNEKEGDGGERTHARFLPLSCCSEAAVGLSR
jgi:hypothetical protein